MFLSLFYYIPYIYYSPNFVIEIVITLSLNLFALIFVSFCFIFVLSRLHFLYLLLFPTLKGNREKLEEQYIIRCNLEKNTKNKQRKQSKELI